MLKKNLFKFNDHDLLIHEDIRQELWFRGTNVCSILGFANSSETLRLYVPDMIQELAIGEGRPAYYVAEKGLYILAFKAKTPVALEFQLWAADVIKTIRKTGSYVAKAADQQHFQPFGLVIQQKIEECDRYLEAAQPDANIAKVLRNRKALEAAYRAQPRAKAEKPRSNGLEPFLAAWHGAFGSKEVLAQDLVKEAAQGDFKSALMDFCYDHRTQSFNTRRLANKLRDNKGTMAGPYKLIRSTTGQRTDGSPGKNGSYWYVEKL
jgi:prophage antirepressor-like protein